MCIIYTIFTCAASRFHAGGVYGWYPLLPPNIPCEPPVSGPTPQQSHPPVVTCSYVGGVEVSASFPNSRDRELVLSCVEKSGYHPDDLLEIGGASKWEVKLEVSALWVQNDLMALASCETNVLCFVRYKFFDLGRWPLGVLPVFIISVLGCSV